MWADGVHFNVRLEEAAAVLLVIVGVRPDGDKELVVDHRRLPGVDRELGGRAA